MQREVYEELNIELPASAVVWEKRYARHKKPDSIFMVAQLPTKLRHALRLGDEGQAFTRMDIDEYSHHPKAIPTLVHRLSDYLNTCKDKGEPPS
ncbi:NUDIX domain [Halomonadaceae bacterium LMG 33818]